MLRVPLVGELARPEHRRAASESPRGIVTVLPSAFSMRCDRHQSAAPRNESCAGEMGHAAVPRQHLFGKHEQQEGGHPPHVHQPADEQEARDFRYSMRSRVSAVVRPSFMNVL
jgi:hypothetical protein